MEAEQRAEFQTEGSLVDSREQADGPIREEIEDLSKQISELEARIQKSKVAAEKIMNKLMKQRELTKIEVAEKSLEEKQRLRDELQTKLGGGASE